MQSSIGNLYAACPTPSLYIATGRGLENVWTLRIVVVQFGVPVLAVVSVVRAHCIGVVVKVEPSAHTTVCVCTCKNGENRIPRECNQNYSRVVEGIGS